MFEWYRRASVCLVYVADVTTATAEQDPLEKQIERSKWFTRGWTLQELLAPRQLEFYERNWYFLAKKGDMKDLIQSITGVQTSALDSFDPKEYTVAQRMSWISRRMTTRPEDMAYSLLGIFGVNMPLLYGEGRKAFIRLQEAILSTTDDQSLFAWKTRGIFGDSIGLLASSPAYFEESGIYVSRTLWNTGLPPSLTNKGITLDLF